MDKFCPRCNRVDHEFLCLYPRPHFWKGSSDKIGWWGLLACSVGCPIIGISRIFYRTSSCPFVLLATISHFVGCCLFSIVPSCYAAMCLSQDRIFLKLLNVTRCYLCPYDTVCRGVWKNASFWLPIASSHQMACCGWAQVRSCRQSILPRSPSSYHLNRR